MKHHIFFSIIAILLSICAVIASPSNPTAIYSDDGITTIIKGNLININPYRHDGAAEYTQNGITIKYNPEKIQLRPVDYPEATQCGEYEIIIDEDAKKKYLKSDLHSNMIFESLKGILSSDLYTKVPKKYTILVDSENKSEGEVAYNYTREEIEYIPIKGCTPVDSLKCLKKVIKKKTIYRIKKDKYKMVRAPIVSLDFVTPRTLYREICINSSLINSAVFDEEIFLGNKKGIIPAPSFIVSSQEDWNAGTYNRTFANSSGILQLNLSFTNGTYLSEIFDASGNAQWNSISWNSDWNDTMFALHMKHNDSLIAYYNFSTPDTEGIIGNGIYFNRTNNKFIPMQNNTNFTTENFTVSLWIKPDGIEDNILYSVNYEISGIDSGWMLGLRNDGSIAFDINGDNDNTVESSPINLYASGTWQMLTVVKKGTTQTYYINGTNIGSDSVGASGTIRYDEKDNVYIGYTASIYCGQFTIPGCDYAGYMDEFMVFSRALSDTEVKNLYNNQSKGITNDDFLGDNSLRSHITFEDIGNRKDSSKYHNHLFTTTNERGSGRIGCGLNQPERNIDYGVSETNNRITIKNNATFSFWIKPRFGRGTVMQQGWRYDRVEEYGWVIHLGSNDHTSTNNNSISWGSGDDSGNYNAGIIVQTDTDTIKLNKWQHIAILKNDTLVRIYINGELNKSKDISVADIKYTLGRTFYIGQSHPSDSYYNDYHYNGIIDEIKIWNTTLSEEEIYSIYKREAAKLNISVRSCDDASCSGETFTNETTNAPINLTGISNNRYFQYMMEFETLDNDITPTVASVSINYTSLGGDTTPPTITNLRNTSTTNESTFIEWDCSESCNYSIILYAPTQSVFNNTFAASHNPYFSGLLNSTTYHINLTVWDSSGNNASNNSFSFTTAANIPPTDSCTCPGFGSNHQFDMSDDCVVSSCLADEISFVNTGYVNCTGIWNISGITGLAASQILYIANGCILYIR